MLAYDEPVSLNGVAPAWKVYVKLTLVGIFVNATVVAALTTPASKKLNKPKSKDCEGQDTVVGLKLPAPIEPCAPTAP